jgi:hypothetical protein
VRYISAFAATLSTFNERISLLYVLNDVLFHSTNTMRETKSFMPSSMVQFLPAIVLSVQTAPDAAGDPLDKLFKLWAEKRYFSHDEYLQVTGRSAKEMTAPSGQVELIQKDLVKPASLGTKGDSHWLLPVSCMLEAVVLRCIMA